MRVSHNKKPTAKIICKECGVEFEVQPYRASTAKYCNWRCGQIAKNRISTRLIAERYRGTGTKGYVKLNGRHEHRVVMEQVLGRRLLSSEIVHHKNRNKHDNRPENLEIVFQTDHIKEHRIEMLAARKEKAGY